jgi:23S rRNA pseudouridine2605 synthase
VLADFGLGSRRQIDRWVVEGRITIDGRRAKPGDLLSGRERVCIDGRAIKVPQGRSRARHSFLLYYKPSGKAAKQDPDERRRRGDIPPPKHGRWIRVAALDTHAAGLVVLTTDGDLAHRLMRSGSRIEREYAARLLGEPTPAQLRQLTEGVEVDGGLRNVESVKAAGGAGTNVWYHCVVREGGSRELRELFDAVGLGVSRIIRVRYGPIKLGELHRGNSRPLDRAEIDALYTLVAEPRRRGPARTTRQ